jgi:hypothetical protein
MNFDLKLGRKRRRWLEVVEPLKHVRRGDEHKALEVVQVFKLGEEGSAAMWKIFFYSLFNFFKLIFRISHFLHNIEIFRDFFT